MRLLRNLEAGEDIKGHFKNLVFAFDKCRQGL